MIIPVGSCIWHPLLCLAYAFWHAFATNVQFGGVSVAPWPIPYIGASVVDVIPFSVGPYPVTI
jgi:hypothetical protein